MLCWEGPQTGSDADVVLTIMISKRISPGSTGGLFEPWNPPGYLIYRPPHTRVLL